MRQPDRATVRLPDRAVRAARTLRAGAVGTLRWLLRRWRRSLRVQVALTTFVLSGAVVALVGVVIMQQVTSGLVHARTTAALGQFRASVIEAQQQFEAADRTDAAALPSTVEAIVRAVGNRGGSTGQYDVALLTTSAVVFGATTASVSDIPLDLRDAVRRSGQMSYVFTRLHTADGTEVPGLVVGGAVRVGPGVDGNYYLYLLFPLDQEAQTVSLVRRTLLFAGAALVLLLVGVAWLVTRQVVRPVRAAAQTAKRLAAGLLRERMTVRGEHEIATLAASFNDMAGSLQAHISQLEDLSRVQRRFVSDVSHELRTPLTTVRMAADLLYEARTEFPPAVARSAELLTAELDRFEALLVDLLEISRHDAGAVVPETEPVDLRTLVESVADWARPLAARRGCPIVLDLPAEPVVAEVDSRRIDRVLRNLLSNAVEYGEGRPVQVVLRGADGAVAVMVRDHGIGLRPGEAALVFNRFWRADPARTRSTGGTGLGLAIALEDSRLHGGWLQAWGEPGHGSWFRLTLPCRAGEQVLASPLPLGPYTADGPLPGSDPGLPPGGTPAGLPAVPVGVDREV